MSVPRPLTRTIGETERTLQALLGSRLAGSGLSFQQWTVCVFLAGGALPKAALLARLAEGQIALGNDADATITDMSASGRLVFSGDLIALSDAGRAVFETVKAEVTAVTEEVFSGIERDAMEVTQRTLGQVAEKARALLERAA